MALDKFHTQNNGYCNGALLQINLTAARSVLVCLQLALKHKYIEPKALSLNGSRTLVYFARGAELIWQTWRTEETPRQIPSPMFAQCVWIAGARVCECERARNDKSESNSAITTSERG